MGKICQKYEREKDYAFLYQMKETPKVVEEETQQKEDVWKDEKKEAKKDHQKEACPDDQSEGRKDNEEEDWKDDQKEGKEDKQEDARKVPLLLEVII